MLALGDSFISGEGARRYLEGTNVAGTDAHNECRRAPTAYPYLVAAELGYRLDFVACSGATVSDLTECGQMSSGPAGRRCAWTPDELAATRAEQGERPPGALPQLANFTDDELQEFDVVLLSIGGNDVGFSDIVQACLLPRDCSERESIWIANVRDNHDRFRSTYEQVRSVVRADTPVIVMPYPMIVTGDPCPLSIGLSGPEHGFVERFIVALDDELRSAAAAAGVHFFEESIGSFDGVQLCDRTKGANHLKVTPPEGTWTLRYRPDKWIHDSMHPNEVGHRRITDELAPFVSSLLAEVDGGAPANPDPVPPIDRGDAPAPGDDEQAEEARQVLSNDEWISAELYRTLRALLLPLFVLVASGMLLAAGFLRLDVRLAERLRPRGVDGDTG